MGQDRALGFARGAGGIDQKKRMFGIDDDGGHIVWLIRNQTGPVMIPVVLPGEVFEVFEMIADIPEEAHNCYGPCPGFETAEADAIAEAAMRLSDLADAAEAAAQETTMGGLVPTESEVCSDEAIDANLEALEALGIVEVGDLLVVEAEYSPHCYAGNNPSDTEPCGEDAYQAAHDTCYRAAKLAHIAEVAEEL